MFYLHRFIMHNIIIYIWSLLTLIITVVSTNPKLDYGPLTIVIGRFETCKGPKRKDCTDIKLGSKGSVATYDVLVKSSFKLTVGRIVATSNGREMVKFHMKEPCDHFLIKSLLRIYMNITQECAVKKEHYVFKSDMHEILDTYFNGKYFYGNWTFRSVFAGSECNFICTIMELIMTPKKFS